MPAELGVGVLRSDRLRAFNVLRRAAGMLRAAGVLRAVHVLSAAGFLMAATVVKAAGAAAGVRMIGGMLGGQACSGLWAC